jgi:signal transduction histidine kinase
MKKAILALTIMVLLATTAMVITHYFTIKILSASRSYINGESQYSKGQKDAISHLISFIYSHEEGDYLWFKNDISIPQGDRIAREALVAGKDYREARIGFLMGKNHPDDLADMIWLFEKFHNYGLFKNAVKTWQEADELVEKLNKLGALTYQRTHASPAENNEDEQDLILQITTISDQLTIKQQIFSDTLGLISRQVNHYIFIADLIISFIIIIGSALLAGIMFSKINRSKKLIMFQNEELKLMNERMDKFVYNVTHDLRSPLNSLTGLVTVLEAETNITNVTKYTSLMKHSLQLQDKFIQDVLNTIKNNDTGEIQLCNLPQIIEDVISQNNFFAEGRQVKFFKELEITEIRCSAMQTRIIFNNLVSNAIKYADLSKPEQWIKIQSYCMEQFYVIEVEDNGLGIPADKQHQIFDKHFKAGDNKKSMGLGLHFVKEAIDEMGGSITVQSRPGMGTTFKFTLPLLLPASNKAAMLY